MNINGKSAIVFGGTSGIGHALAARGTAVHAISRSTECAAGNLPPEATSHKCDVRDETPFGSCSPVSAITTF